MMDILTAIILAARISALAEVELTVGTLVLVYAVVTGLGIIKKLLSR